MPSFKENKIELSQNDRDHLLSVISKLSESQYTPATLDSIHSVYHTGTPSLTQETEVNHQKLTKPQLLATLKVLVSEKKIKAQKHRELGEEYYTIRRALR